MTNEDNIMEDIFSDWLNSSDDNILEDKSHRKFDAQPDEWPFLAQGELLKILARLGYKLTSQTMRRWQKLHVISAPSYRNVGARANIASYRLFACAECYAAAVLSDGKTSLNGTAIPNELMPKISLASIAYVRFCAYGFGKGQTMPRRNEIEDKIGRRLPLMPDILSLNLRPNPHIQHIANGRYDRYYEGCQVLWEEVFVEGIVKLIQECNVLHGEETPTRFV